MKKLILATVALAMAATGANAQTALVKQSQGEFKKVQSLADYKKAVKNLSPAFASEETGNDPATYMLPGNAGFDLYDNLYKMAMVGQPVDEPGMAEALMEGYDFMMKALPLDSLPDEKGKVKAKHSKKIVGAVAAHINDFSRAGEIFWEAQNYPRAYDAWEAFLDIPANPRYKSTGVNAYPDSIAAKVRYFQGLAAYTSKDFQRALTAFGRARDLDPDNSRYYELGYESARQIPDSVALVEWAQAGYDRFGASDPLFLQWLVNARIDKKDYDGARALLSDAISKYPNVPAVYVSYGQLSEDAGDLDEAKANYRKAISMDSENAPAYVYLGRVIISEYDKLDQAAGSMPQNEYNKYNYETLRPMLVEAAGYFEKAYSINPELTQVLQPLKTIYYQLNDAANLERINNEIMK